MDTEDAERRIEADFDRMLKSLLALGRQRLRRRGPFFPFAGGLRADGSLTPVVEETGGADADPIAIIDRMVAGFHKEAVAGNLRATGICVAIRVVPPGGTRKATTLCVQLEHVDGPCVDVHLPYRKRALIGYKFGDTFAVHRIPRVFVEDKRRAG